MIFNMVGGGGGSSTKSTIIVSIDTGSTVAAYSDSGYTTLVKTATEKSSGEFWLTGLDNGTYYIKATLNGDEATASYTISEYGVYRITMTYFQATITATFPTSCSSVTLTDGVDTYSVPSADIANGTYAFTVTSTGTYTGQAICGEYTMVADSVVISTNGESTTTKYKLWLYNGSLGESGSTGANVCYSLTGGYTYAPAGTYQGTSSSLTFNNDNMKLVPYSNSAAWAINTIDVTPFSTLFVDSLKSVAEGYFGVAADTGAQTYDARTVISDDNTRAVRSCDISAITGNKYIKIYKANIYSYHTVYSMWLE